MTMADISFAPYMCRMIVLEHYRNFSIPKSFKNWHEWN